MREQILGVATPPENQEMQEKGVPIRGVKPWRRQQWTVETLMFEKGILRLTSGPVRLSLQGTD